MDKKIAQRQSGIPGGSRRKKSPPGPTLASPGSRRRLWPFLLLWLSLLLLAACARPGGPPEPTETATPAAEEPAPAETAVPLRGTTILAEGQLAAVTPQLALSFSANGRLLAIHVQPGDKVAQGQLIATLDDQALQDALADTDLALRQAENSLAQAQLSLDDLLSWQPDETAVAQAEASLAAAEASLAAAQNQDAASGNSLTSARVSLEQAERSLQNAQDAYDTAYDPGREWELFIDDPSCRTAEEYPNCTGAPYSDNIKRERESADYALPQAQDNLEVARANYNLAAAGLKSNSAIDAEAAVANARQALSQAQIGPQAGEIAAARLQVEQAELSLEGARINQQQAASALEDTELVAPWAGTILTIDSAPGALVGSGTPIVTLLDTGHLQFQTNNLSERDLAQITPGQAATITLKAYPNDPLAGTVARIAPVAEGTVGDAATFTVIITLEETELALLAGMTGRVEISGE